MFAALVGLAFDNGGFFSGAWATAAVGLFWVAALVLLLRDEIEVSRLEWWWLGLLAAFLLWTTLSLAWSVNHAEPWLEVRRGLVYLGGAATIAFTATRRATEDVLIGVWAAASLVIAYALGRYLLEPGAPDQFQLNLLFRPVGYANGLAIFTGMASIVGIALAAHATSRGLRAVGAASIAPSAAALSLTASRASALAVVSGLAAMFLVDRRRLRLGILVVLIAPAAAFAVALSEQSGLSDAVRTTEPGRQGRLLAVWLFLLAAALAAAPALAERISSRVRPPRRTGSRGVAAIALIALLVVAAVVSFGRVPGFFSTGARPAYLRVAWTEYGEHPLLGSGAGTFADYWLRDGDPSLAGGALDAHNLYVETLAELGPVGLALLVATLALPFAAAFTARTHPLTSGAIGAYVAFLAHAALDWDWELPVVTLAGLACAASVLVAARDADRVRRATPAARAALLTVVVLLALFALTGEVVPGLGGTFH